MRTCIRCPIDGEGFLINNEKCLTYFNKAGSEYDFPERLKQKISILKLKDYLGVLSGNSTILLSKGEKSYDNTRTC